LLITFEKIRYLFGQSFKGVFVVLKFVVANPKLEKKGFCISY